MLMRILPKEYVNQNENDIELEVEVKKGGFVNLKVKRRGKEKLYRGDGRGSF